MPEDKKPENKPEVKPEAKPQAQPLVKQMDTTKEAVKARLDRIAGLTKGEWHSQFVHKMAVLSFMLDMLGIEDKAVREAAKAQWNATPNAFGANASAMAQALGRESKGAKTEKAFEGI